MKTRVFFLSVCALVISFVIAPKVVSACGHDGFFIGGGYQQMFMYTPEDQLRGAGQLTSSQITFGPGFGAHLLFGYDFEGSRWGIQMPFGYSNFKLNRSERVNYFDTAVEGILHLASWENGIDVNLVGGIGVSILPEGPNDNNTGALGMNFGIGPGFNWFFHRSESISSSVYVQVPIRVVLFFGDNLSKNHTTALQVPIRVGVSLGF
jgi:hypothetical protein